MINQEYPKDGGNFQTMLARYSGTIFPLTTQGMYRGGNIDFFHMFLELGLRQGKAEQLSQSRSNFSQPSTYHCTYFLPCTGLDYKGVPRLQECCRQVEAEEFSSSRNKFTKPGNGLMHSRALYVYNDQNN